MSGRAQLPQIPRALRRHRLVLLDPGHRAALERRARLFGPLLAGEDLPEQEVGIECVRAFLRIPAVGLASLVQLPLLGVDGPELPPAEAVLRRYRQRGADLADPL